LSQLDPSANIAATVTPFVGALQRLPTSATVSIFCLTRTPVRLARPVPSTATVAATATLVVDDKPPLIYCRPSNALSCAFAERGDWSLLRTPNDDLLRIAEACLREAVINVEFLRVKPHVLGLASLTAALALNSPTVAPQEVAAIVRAVTTFVGLSDLEHYKSATQLVVEKYVEAVQTTPPAVVPGSVEPPVVLPCPSNAMEIVDAVLALIVPKSSHKTTVA
jgi:hypothetical protein